MNRAKIIATLGMLALAVALVSAFPAEAQGRGPGKGLARNQQVERNFDPGTVVTVSGTVQEVLVKEGASGSIGMHLLLDVNGESIEADIGPNSYLIANGLDVGPGDRVTVTGSKAVVGGEPAFIARQITGPDASLSLRDASGIPLWAGQGRRAAEGGRGVGRGLRAGGVGGASDPASQAALAGRGYGRGPQAVATGAGYGRGARAVATGAGYRRGAQSAAAGPGSGRGRRAGRGGGGMGQGATDEPVSDAGFGCRRGQRRGRGAGRGNPGRNGKGAGTEPRVVSR